MRLLEAVVDANHRALSGDPDAGLHPSEFSDSLPIVALTCIDPRLNPLLPNVLGIPPEKFIWLRNAGNILTSSISSTMRSLSLACAVKGGREIAIVGHTDCLVGRTSMLELTERLKNLGIDRSRLPANLVELFGLFGHERQNVLKAVELARASPLIGPRIPVHGLLLDTQTGRLEWVVNGYETLLTPTGLTVTETTNTPGQAPPPPPLPFADWKLPNTQIGEFAGRVEATSAKLEAATDRIGIIAQRIGEAIPGLAPTTDRIGHVAEQFEQAAEKAREIAARLQLESAKNVPLKQLLPVHRIPPSPAALTVPRLPRTSPGPTRKTQR